MPGLSVVVIGAGPAGCAAAVQLARLGCAPLLIDRTGEPGGLCRNAFSIENYPGLEPLGGRAFAGRLRGHLERFAIAIERREAREVVAAEGGLEVRTDLGPLLARAAIAGVGTRPVPLEIPGAAEAQGEFLFYEVDELLRRLPAPRCATVVGSGEAALDYALSLAAAGARVRVLARGGEPRARGRLLDLVRATPAIEILCGVSPAAIVRRDGRFALTLAPGGAPGALPCDALLAAVGRRSAAGRLAPALAAAGAGADAPLTTPLPGLFLAGDARLGSLGQIAMAVGDGVAAAAAAAALVRAASPSAPSAPGDLP